MTREDDHLSSLADAFYAAAVESSWSDALARLAEATGSRSGQLIGVGEQAEVPFNLITNLDMDAVGEWAAMGGADPRVNPRVRAGLTAPELTSLTEADFASEAELQSAIYRLYRKYDIHHSCQTTLVRSPDSAIGLAVLRSERQGPIPAEAMRTFTALAPYVRGAVRMQMTLEAQGAALLAGAFGAVNLAAFVCNPAGEVCALSPEAERLAGKQSHLRLAGRRLSARHPHDDRRLAAAIARAGSRWPSPPKVSDLSLRAGPDAPLLHVQVAPLPAREHGFRFQATSLVIARLPADPARRAEALADRFGLTPAEAQVALGLAHGRTLASIAAERGVTVSTLRSQLKSIFGKLGVSRQAELAARVSEL